MDPIRLSMAELCSACADEAWRAEWLRADRAEVMPLLFGSDDAQFRSFVRKFLGELLRDDARPERIAPVQLLNALLGTGAGAHIDALLAREQIDDAGAFSDALHNFCERLDQLSARVPGARGWSELFLSGEQPLVDVRIKTDLGVLLVSGTIECVRRHPSGELELVDYTLRQGTQRPQDLIPLAIQRSLFAAREPGCRGALEYFLPRLRTEEADAETLDDVFRTYVAPVLPELASQQRPSGVARTGNPTAVRVLPRPIPLEPESEPDARPTLLLGRTRGSSAEPVLLSAQELSEHAALVGAAGSGKTTLALSLIEQALRLGVPAVLIDRKGDLCRYGALAQLQRAELPGNAARKATLARFLHKLDVAVFTPGDQRGRALAIGLLPEGIETLRRPERHDACKVAADALGRMLNLKGSPIDQAKLAILIQALHVLAENHVAAQGAVGIEQLIALVAAPPESLIERLGPIDSVHCTPLAQHLQTLKIMRGALFSTTAERLTAGVLLGHGASAVRDKTRLSIVSTKFLGDEASVLFWISQLLVELGRYASRTPSGVLQALVLFDEAEAYIPGASRPPTKEPMESLLARAGDSGLGVMLASERPEELDPRALENVGTVCIGTVKGAAALDKLAPLLAAASRETAALVPKQRVGQFVVLSDGRAQALQAERSLVDTRPAPSEAEILAIAKASLEPALATAPRSRVDTR